MVWSIETDDFQGKCHGKKYPLLTAINEEFADPSVALPLPPETPATVVQPSYPDASTSSSYPSSSPSTTSTTSTTTSTTTTTTTTTTTPRPSTPTYTTTKPSSTTDHQHDPINAPTFVCTRDGLQRDPHDCQKFHSCVRVQGETGSTFLPYEFSCPPGTVFDEKIKGCNVPAEVEGCENATMQIFSFFRPTSI